MSTSDERGAVGRTMRVLRVPAYIAAAALIIAAGVYEGGKRLTIFEGASGSITSWMYVPAVMFASGEGFINVDPVRVPGLIAFLEYQAPSFAMPAMDEPPPAMDWGPHERYHRYLVYTLGLWWRVTGVSWAAVRALVVVLLCLCGLLVHGILRLAMGRLLALAGALWFVMSPHVFFGLPLLRGVAESSPTLGPLLWPGALEALPVLRDFAKAPFFLAAMLLLGRFVARRMTPRACLGWALATGLVLGFGLGFRRDLLMALPPALVAAACARGTRPLGLARRAAAAALVAGGFLLAGAPILHALRDEGSLGYHDTLMGMTTFSDEALGLEEASYERLPVLHDMYVYLAGWRQGTRDLEPGAESEPMKRHYLLQLARTFPADMLARGYSAVLRAMTFSAWPGVKPWILAAGVLFFLLLHRHGPRAPWLTLFLVLYFCGYTVLQYNPRHIFHLEFLPLLFAGHVVQRAASAVTAFARGRNRPVQWRRWAAGAVSLSLLLAAAGGAMATARAWQEHRVRALIGRYREAPAAPVPLERRALEDLVWLAPAPETGLAPCAPDPAEPLYRASCFVAVFGPGPGEPAFWIRHEDSEGRWSLSHVVHARPLDAVGNGGFRYYFPVYEWFHPGVWNRFTGLAMAPELAGRFRGLQRLERPGELPLLVNLTLPDDSAALALAQRIRPFEDAPPARFPRLGLCTDPDAVAVEAFHLRQRGLHRDAARLCREMLACFPDAAALYVVLAESLEAAGQTDDAVDALRAGIDRAPDDPVLYRSMDALLSRTGEELRALETWSALVMAHPAQPCPAHYLDHAWRALATSDLASGP